MCEVLEGPDWLPVAGQAGPIYYRAVDDEEIEEEPENGPLIRLDVVTGDIAQTASGWVAVPFVDTWRFRRGRDAAGSAGALRQVAGPEPWREIKGAAVTPDSAVASGSGDLTHLGGIVHVATAFENDPSSPGAVSRGLREAIRLAELGGARQLTVPLLGTGFGGLRENLAFGAMGYEIEDSPIPVTIVRFAPAN